MRKIQEVQKITFNKASAAPYNQNEEDNHEQKSVH